MKEATTTQLIHCPSFPQSNYFSFFGLKVSKARVICDMYGLAFSIEIEISESPSLFLRERIDETSVTRRR